MACGLSGMARAVSMHGRSAVVSWINLLLVLAVLLPCLGSLMAEDVLPPGARVWLRADRVEVNGDGQVARWIDASGNGNDALLAAQGVTLEPTAFNGNPAVLFSGGYLQMPDCLRSMGLNAEVIIVQRTTNGDSYGHGLSTALSYYGNQWQVDGNGMGGVWWGRSISCTMQAQSWNVYHSRSSAEEGFQTLTTLINNAQVQNAVVAESAEPWSTLPWIGASHYPGAADNVYAYFYGSVAEVIVYPRSLAANEVDTIIGYLVQRYGVQPPLVANCQGEYLGLGRRMVVHWDGVVDPGVGYEVQRKVNGGDYLTVAMNITAGQTGNGTYTFHDIVAESGMVSYRVRGANMAGVGAWTTAADMVTGDGAVMEPGGMLTWLRSDRGVERWDGYSVYKWADQSGSGNDASQRNGSPYYVADGYNDSLPSIRFDGESSSMILPEGIFAGVQDGEIFIVQRRNAEQTGGHHFTGSDSNPSHSASNQTVETFGRSAGYVIQDSGSSFSDWKLLNLSAKTSVQPGTWVARINGLTVGQDDYWYDGSWPYQPVLGVSFDQVYRTSGGSYDYWYSESWYGEWRWHEYYSNSNWLYTPYARPWDNYGTTTWSEDFLDDQGQVAWTRLHEESQFYSDGSYYYARRYSDDGGSFWQVWSDDFPSYLKYECYFDGDIAEVLLFNHVLSDQERQEVVRYLDARYQPGGGAAVPPAPSLVARPLSSTAVEVKWTANRVDLAFEVQRAIGGAGFEIAASGSSGSGIMDRVPESQTVAYRVRVRDPNSVTGWSADNYWSQWSEVVTVVTGRTSTVLDSVRLWLRADCGVEVDQAGHVTTWRDVSGNGHHFTPAPWGSSKATLVERDAINGRPGLLFDSSGSFYWNGGSDLFGGMKGGELVLVQRRIGQTSAMHQFGANGARDDGSSIWDSFGRSSLASFPSGADTTQWTVFDYAAGTEAWEARVNGALASSAANIPVVWPGPCVLGGAMTDYYGPWSSFTGVMSEVILFDHSLSEVERQQVHAYLGGSLLADFAPSIADQPDSIVVNPGQVASFAVKANGTAPLSYQWFLNGAMVEGANGATWGMSGVTVVHDGSVVTVAVTNSLGTALSHAATLSVNHPPVVTSPPLPVDIVEGSMATFGVTASGTAPLSYQWSRNGVTISGATGSGYSVMTDGTSWDGSLIHVDVVNMAGRATSEDVTMVVRPAPVLAVGQTIEGAIATAYDRRWYRINVPARDGYRVSVATASADPGKYSLATARLRVLNAAGTVELGREDVNGILYFSLDGGAYIVEVSGWSSLIGSYAVSLHDDVELPTITASPASASIAEGQKALFLVTATSVAPVRYQWLRNGVAIPYATGREYAEYPSDTSLDGSLYQVQVTNVAGSVLSEGVTLHVQPAPTLAVGQTIDGEISVTDEHDWYRVAIGARGIYQVVAAHGTLSYDYIRMRTSTGAPIGEGAGLLTVTLEPGQYIIDMRGEREVRRWHPTGHYYYYQTVYYTGTYSISLFEMGPPVISGQPGPVSINDGQTAQFNVVATGFGPFSYQWSRNDVDIPGATGSGYVIEAVDAALDGSVYRVTVSNPVGSVVSNPATLHVTTRAQQVIEGFMSLAPRTYGDGPVTISGVTGGGSGNPVLFTSSDNGVAVIAGATMTIVGAGTVVITASQAGDVNYSPAAPVAQMLVVNKASQTISFAPLAPRAFGTSPFSLTATASSGLPTALAVDSGPGSLMGTMLTITDSGTIAITATQAGNGNYLAATPVVQTLAVAATAPVIARQPVGGDWYLGETATLTVAIDNPFQATYQWYQDGTAIPGAESAELLVPGDVAGDGSYVVVVSNRYGSSPSQPAPVRILNRPVVIVTQPSDQPAAVGATAAFTVVATGTPPLTYQWLRQGLPIAGAASSSFTTGTLGLDEDGAILEVDVSNMVGTVRSSPATLRVYAPPSLTAPPTDVTVYEGSQATFTVGVVSIAPTQIRWYREGAEIVGATGPSLTTAATGIADDGTRYTVTITNLAGVVSGGPAALHVLPRLPQLITGFAPLAGLVVGGPQAVITGLVGGGSGNPVTLSSSNTSVATVWGNIVTPVGVGTCQIIADQAGSASYAPAPSVTQTLVVDKGTQVIQFAELRPQSFGLAPRPLVATASSGLPVALTILSGPGTLEGNLLGFTGVGSIVIEAVQAGNDNYHAAPPVTRTQVVEALAPQITRHPRSGSAPVGDPVELSVELLNGYGATFQWYKNGQAVSGATGPSFAAVAPPVDSTDTYAVEATNLVGTIRSQDATVRGVFLRPAILQHPQSVLLYESQSATFAVVAKGSAPLDYRWMRDGLVIPSATAATLVVPALVGADQGASYTVVVSNRAGEVISDPARVRLHAPPTVTDQPLDQVVEVGSSARFHVGVNSTLPVVYRWMKDGIDLPNGTAQDYTVASTTLTDTGSVFQVVAANGLGSATSAVAHLTVVQLPPVITRQPDSLVLFMTGDQAVFTIAARSSLAVTYQWQRNGVPMEGQNGPSYAFIAQEDDFGAVYTVVVTNAIGSTTSANATISRVAKPFIERQPVSITIVEGQRALFAVEAVSFAPDRVLTYQWKLNGLVIPGATDSRYESDMVTLGNSGDTYQVTVSDGPAARESSLAVLTVVPVAAPVAPTVVINPSSVTVDPGERPSLGVLASGTEPLAYQWYLNGAAIPGATNAAYRVTPVLDGDYGNSFFVVVANSFGSATSGVARILGAPHIIRLSSEPQSGYTASVAVGNPVVFAFAAVGRRPMETVWLRNGVVMPEVQGTSLTLAAPGVEDNGAYFSVLVKNADGEATGPLPMLHVFSQPPIIGRHPSNVEARIGGSAGFSVAASSHAQAPMTYQWMKDGIAIDGETRNVLDVTGIMERDYDARYSVEVRNRFGLVVSGSASIRPPQELVITRQPQSVTVTVGERATFTADCSGAVMVALRKDGQTLNTWGGSSLRHTTPPVTVSEHGALYDVVFTGSFGRQIISDAVTLSVVDNPPSITTQPVDAAATVGQNALFWVTATGNQPLHYQWYLNGEVVEGQDSNVVSLPIWSMDLDGARVRVVVSNSRGMVTSNEAILTVSAIIAPILADPDVVAEIHGDSVIIDPRAVVSNGDREHIDYSWTQEMGPSVSSPMTGGVSARLVLTGLVEGSYVLVCHARYGYAGPGSSSIDTTSHRYRFNVTPDLTWITIPRKVDAISEDLAVRLEAKAGFAGTEHATTTYRWAIDQGTTGATFANNQAPEAKQTLVQLPARGRYVVSCVADWRGSQLTGHVIIDTEAQQGGGSSTASALVGRTLLVDDALFDGSRWESSADFRSSYLVGVGPSRVWQSASPDSGKPAIRPIDAVRRQVQPGATTAIRVQVPTGAPVSLAALHGGSFAGNNLNAITRQATDEGLVSVDYVAPRKSGTYTVLVSSPLAVGRIAFIVVVP